MTNDLAKVVEEFRDQFDDIRCTAFIPDITCPAIDKMQKALGYVDKTLRKVKPYNSEDELRDFLEEIESDLSGFGDELEQLRQDNESLRETGKRWYELSKDYLTAIEDRVS